MRKILSMVVVTVSVFMLSGCGGGGSDSIDALSIDRLEEGYRVTGRNATDELLDLYFCGFDYSLDIDGVYENDGTFIIAAGQYIDVDLGDDGSRDFYIDVTAPTVSVLEVGETYDAYDDSNVWMNLLTVDEIVPIICP